MAPRRVFIVGLSCIEAVPDAIGRHMKDNVSSISETVLIWQAGVSKEGQRKLRQVQANG